MTRPQSEAEYLARLVPPSVAALGRRAVLAWRPRTLARSAAAPCSPPAAASSSGSSASSSARRRRCRHQATGTVTFGSNAVGRRAEGDLRDSSSTTPSRRPGCTVKVNTVDHKTFQEQINNYLQGKPDDVFTWFAGYRMRFFAAQGLVGDVSDIWGNLQGFTDAFKTASTGDDGKQYFVPQYVLPVGRVLPQVGRGRSTATRCRRRWTTSRRSRQDEEGRARPDRLRRQGRLAGDGHLRHPQHADQRVPVPRRPDGPQEAVDRPGRHEGLPDLGRSCPTTRRARSAAPGRRPRRACSRRRPACTCSACSSPSSSPKADLADVDFFTFPEIDSVHRGRRPRRPDRRLHDGEEARRTRPAPRRCSGTSAAPTRGTFYAKTDPTTLIANSKARHVAPTPRCRRRRPSSSARRRTSPSSSTATPGPTSPRPS